MGRTVVTVVAAAAAIPAAAAVATAAAVAAAAAAAHAAVVIETVFDDALGLAPVVGVRSEDQQLRSHTQALVS